MSFVILDRDGVINYDSDEYIKSPDEWHPIPGSLEAMARLNRAGYRILIATNQSGISRGYYDIEMLDQIHAKLMHELAAVGGYVDEIFFCPHLTEDDCYCRKPKPGLLLQIEAHYPINLSETYFIGDSYTDVQAAQAAGCLPLLVLTGKKNVLLEQFADLVSVPNFPDLKAAVEYILSQPKSI